MTIIRNVLAVLLGALVGSVVNMTIINNAEFIIPYPEGVDFTTVEGISAGIQLYQPYHFIMPFLAHALGTLVGALVAGFIAATHKKSYSYAIGVLFLIGGISMLFQIPHPLWFAIVDIGGAYIPMAWIAIQILQRIPKKSFLHQEGK